MNSLQHIETYNTRAPEMWSIISDAVDFEGKSVLDLGCGGGDMLIYSHHAGADKIVGIDKDSRTISDTRIRIDEIIPDSGITLSIDNIESMEMSNFDIIMCFSVLPYLSRPEEMLNKIRNHSSVALIECQYTGDGYGFEEINNNRAMLQWLLQVGWNRVSNLGYTDVKIRKAKRTIWKCRDIGE